MSHDTHNSHNEADGPERPIDAAGRDTPGQADAQDENSIPVAPAPEPVHRWLDGEPVDPVDLGAPDAERHVKFWAKMKQETDRRRHLATPRGLDAVIMQKLDPPVEKDD